MLFKCGGEILLCLGFSRLILLFWFYIFVYNIACFSLNFGLCSGNG